MEKNTFFYKNLTEEEKEFLITLNDSKYNPIDNIESSNLIVKAQKGNIEARTKLINSNLRLVVSISKSFYSNGVNLFDLIQEGNLALINAINIYQTNRNMSFSTFAYQVIKWRLYNYTNTKDSVIPIPHNFYTTVVEVKSFIQEYQMKHSQDPTISQIALGLNKTESKIEEILLYINNNNLLSINSSVTVEDEDIELMDVLADSYNLELDCEPRLLWYQLMRVYPKANLTDVETEILKRRYGFYDNKKYTLEEIGKNLGISKERVRILEKNALQRLRIEMINNGKGRSRRKRNNQ